MTGLCGQGNDGLGLVGLELVCWGTVKVVQV